MMIRKLLTLLTTLLCLVPAALSNAESAKTAPFIQDDADLLTEAEEAQLYQDMLPLCEYGTPMLWTTTQSGNFEQQARTFYHQHLGYGQNGTLFVINMNLRQLGIYSDGAVSRTVTASDADTITDNVFRMAGRGQYYDCASSVFSQIWALLRGEQIARPMKIVSNALLALVLAMLGVYLYISRKYEKAGKAGKAKAALPVTAAAAAVFAASTANHVSRMTKQRVTDVSSGGCGGGGHRGGFSGGGGGGGGGSFGSHGF